MDRTAPLEVGRRLIKRRFDLRLSLDNVAGVLKISAETYERIEHGLEPIPPNLLPYLCNLYGLSADYLLTGIPGEEELHRLYNTARLLNEDCFRVLQRTADLLLTDQEQRKGPIPDGMPFSVDARRHGIT